MQSAEVTLAVVKSVYLRLNVFEQNLQLYGLSPESTHAVRTAVESDFSALALLLMSQQMGLSLELLAALVAGRQALSLHCINIVVERQVVHEGASD